MLGDEIALLRVLIKRFADQIQASQGVGLSESAQYLAVISMAMLRLGSLLRTDYLLGGSERGTILEQLNLAIAEVSAEMALEQG